MIKTLFLINSFVMLLVATGYSQVDITGKWKGAGNAPDGRTVDITFNFVTSNETLTGSMDGPMGTKEIRNGKIQGKTFNFDIRMNGRTITHSCEIISEDKIHLKTEMMEMDLTREKNP